MARKEIKEMNKRWREALATPTKPLHDPVPLGEIIDEYLEGKELFDDCISRKAVLDEMKIRRANGDMITAGFIKGLPPVTPKPKTGHWIIKEGREQGYDIAGIKTWYIQIMCDKCGFIKTAIEGHTGQYHFCPNCGAKMESEDK